MSRISVALRPDCFIWGRSIIGETGIRVFKGLKPIVYGGREVWPLVEGGKGVAATNHASAGAWAAAGGIGTVSAVNDECDHVVFLLWGSYAQKKAAFVNQRKHLVLRSPHPSPLSAHNGFFGNGHFSKANAFLISHGRDPIDWQLPESV